jgi:poly-gamma-glutamate capsule biosynthesis protein CapA/YwtB (metallophosphatase superfamily)
VIVSIASLTSRVMLASLALCAACGGDVRAGMRSATRPLTLAVAAAEPTPPSPTATAIPRAEPAPTSSAPLAPIRIAAVGDIMLARTVGARLESDPTSSPFAGVAKILRSADLAIGNLECAVGTGGTAVNKAYTFRAPPLAIGALADAGVDVVSVANNHVLDYGSEVFAETLDLLDRAHVAHAGGGASEEGAHQATVVVAQGMRVAFLGYVKVMAEGKGGAGFDTHSWEAKGSAPGIAWADPERIAKDVSVAKESADVVVVLLHSGFEASYVPNVWQRLAAHSAIDAGATLVVGAHPHVLQGGERYKNGFIAYSLGNFVFDGTNGYSAILQVTLDREGVKEVEWTPVMLRNGAPQLTDDKTAKWIQNVIRSLSLQIGYVYKER